MRGARGHRAAREDDSNPLHDATWLYSYADLMTQLLIFSILMIAVMGLKDPTKRSDRSDDLVETVKRLALSVRVAETPRIISDKEVMRCGEAAGHDNYVPHLTKLLTILRKTLPDMDADQRQALRIDAAPLLAICKAL